MTSKPTLSLEQRKALLDRVVKRYVIQGYRVISHTDTTAQLVKPKRFGCPWILAALCSAGIALLFFLRAKEQTIYLEIDLYGKIRRMQKKV